MNTSNPNPSALEVFSGAIEIPDPEQPKAFLDNTCGGKPALREEVERLLANHQDDSFLEHPAPAATLLSSLLSLSTQPQKIRFLMPPSCHYLKSATSGKAGGLRECEPLKAVVCYREALKAPPFPVVRGVCLPSPAPGCSDARQPRSCPPSIPNTRAPKNAGRRSSAVVPHTLALCGSHSSL
jgi:hypothetical protein